MVAYRFVDSRSGECVARHLDGYRGILQVDGYTAYNRLARPDRGNDAITLAGCWAHVRRKFYELHIAGSSKLATTTIECMTDLWKVEDSVRGRDPQLRVSQSRQETSVAVVADLFELWQDALPRISGKSKLAEAIRYAHLTAGDARTLPHRWPRRDRLQHCGTCHPAAKQLPERTHSSPAATAVDEPGQPSPHCCRPQK